MKKLILSVSAMFFLGTFLAQEYTSNQEGSKYKFEKIAHLDANPVQSQGYTGTCWSFSALSFFESELYRKGMKSVPVLSEMYVVRKSYEGKADKYIRMDGKTNFSQGGAFHDIPWVIRNYGIMPQSAYTGLLNGEDKYNHEELFSAIDGYVQGIKSYTSSLSNGASLSYSWKRGLNGILDAYLGIVPNTFSFEGKEYTPQTFADKLDLNMDDYVSITSYTNHPFYAPCYLAIQDNWNWGKSYNVPLEDMVKIAEEALKNGYTIAWGADVSEKGFNFRNGLAIVPEDPSTIEIKGKDNKNFSDEGAEKTSNAFMEPVKEKVITQEMRQIGYDNKTTTDDHGMHIVGLYKEANGTYYFLVKNSWGTGNFPKGYLYVSENYFRFKTMNFYIHKDAIPSDIAKKLAIK
jgi:bleomycin hydrolase